MASLVINDCEEMLMLFSANTRLMLASTPGTSRWMCMKRVALVCGGSATSTMRGISKRLSQFSRSSVYCVTHGRVTLA